MFMELVVAVQLGCALRARCVECLSTLQEASNASAIQQAVWADAKIKDSNLLVLDF